MSLHAFRPLAYALILLLFSLGQPSAYFIVTQRLNGYALVNAYADSVPMHQANDNMEDVDIVVASQHTSASRSSHASSFTVFGSTGNQGGSVVRAILNHPQLSKEWKVRGITRNPNKPDAQAMVAKGVETVAVCPTFDLPHNQPC